MGDLGSIRQASVIFNHDHASHKDVRRNMGDYLDRLTGEL